MKKQIFLKLSGKATSFDTREMKHTKHRIKNFGNKQNLMEEET